MKTIVIPPKDYVGEFTQDQHHHLILVHELEDNEYREEYDRRADKGDFIILDNGAHELEVGFDIVRLMGMAQRVGVSEVVLPDALFNYKETIQKTSSAIHWLKGHPRTANDFRYMIVPQGNSYHEYQYCLNTMVRDFSTFRGDRFTIGISKDYEVFEGGLHRILADLVSPLFTHFNFDIHLLGWGRQMDKLSTLATDFPWIRSVDSAKPIVFGRNNFSLPSCITLLNNPRYPGRQKDYFECELGASQLEHAHHNIRVFRAQVS